jgi:hypothetical protein
MGSILVPLGVSAYHSMLSMYQLSATLNHPHPPWASWKQNVRVTGAQPPKPQDHWQAQSVGSCTV